MTDDPNTLRRYATLFEKPCRDPVERMIATTEACQAAARALRYQADALDRLKEY